MSETTPSRYWSVLGLSPDTSLEQLEMHYTLVAERFPTNPTEDEERECEEIRRAYGVLRRACEARETQAAPDAARPISPSKWKIVALSVVLSVTSSLVAVNLKSIRVALTTVETGTELRIQGRSEPFGTVVGFDATHAFPAGKPGPAYRVRLAGTGEEIWVGERTVELGMER